MPKATYNPETIKADIVIVDAQKGDYIQDDPEYYDALCNVIAFARWSSSKERQEIASLNWD